MKILIADKLSPKTVSELESLGAEVSVNPDLKADDLPKAIRSCEVLIVRSTKVTADTIGAADALSLIIRAGAGVNTIDCECASCHSIYVANTPGKNTDAVAELAIGLLIAADRRIVDACSDLRNNKWRKKEYQKSSGLKGRTLGIVGLGAIGRAVAKRALGLEMRVVAWSRSLTPEKAEELGLACARSLNELATCADAVSVHVAASANTKHLIDSEFLTAMKDGSILINTARGEVVDTAALKRAIKDKGLRVGLDVYEHEPAAGDDEFKDGGLAASMTGTPHIGASTDQASEAVADEVVRIVKCYVETGIPLNTVNIREKSSAIYNLVVRHYNRVGVLARVLDLLREEGVNIEEMNNLIFDGGEAASCTLKLDSKPTKALIRKIRESSDIIQVNLK